MPARFRIVHQNKDDALDALARIAGMQTQFFSKRLAKDVLNDLVNSYRGRMHVGNTLYQGIKDALRRGGEPGSFTGATLRGFRSRVKNVGGSTEIEFYLHGHWPDTIIPRQHISLEEITSAMLGRGVPLKKLANLAVPWNKRRLVATGPVAVIRKYNLRHPIPVYTDAYGKYYRAIAAKNTREMLARAKENIEFQPIGWEQPAGAQLVEEHKTLKGGSYFKRGHGEGGRVQMEGIEGHEEEPMSPEEKAMMHVWGNVTIDSAELAREMEETGETRRETFERKHGEITGWKTQARQFGQLGAYVQVAPGSGFTIDWDEGLKNHGFKDVKIPAQSLESKVYGEFGNIQDFMYLSDRQCNDITNYVMGEVGRLIDNDFGGPPPGVAKKAPTYSKSKTQQELANLIVSSAKGTSVKGKGMPETVWVSFGDVVGPVAPGLFDTDLPSQAGARPAIINEQGEMDVRIYKGKEYVIPRTFDEYLEFNAWMAKMQGGEGESELDQAVGYDFTKQSFENDRWTTVQPPLPVGKPENVQKVIDDWEAWFQKGYQIYTEHLDETRAAKVRHALSSMSPLNRYYAFNDLARFSKELGLPPELVLKHARQGGYWPEMAHEPDFDFDLAPGEMPGWLQDALYKVTPPRPKRLTDEELLMKFFANREYPGMGNWQGK